MTKPLRAAAAALITVVCAFGADATPVQAQSELDGILQMQLESIVPAMASEGFSLEQNYRSGWLDDGEAEELSLALLGDRTYMIVGVCDQDCSDLDMALRTEQGADVDSDYEMDDVPIVFAETNRSGAIYVLRVSMPTCSIEPCSYGVGLFSRQN